MYRIEPNETELTGNWVVEDGHVHGDTICDRVNWLTKNCLQQIGYSRDGGGWETLYRDPRDGRLWERTYPHGEMQGGGPPRLAILTPDEAAKKYNVASIAP